MVPPEEVRAAVFDRTPESILFRYCTEALLEGDSIDRAALRREAALAGDSVVIAGGATRVRLHVHTNEPEKLFEIVARFGEVAQTKVEDMRSQHETRFDRNRAERVAIVRTRRATAPLPVRGAEHRDGPGARLLRVRNYSTGDLTPAEFYARFAVTDVEPKTSQPPPAEFTQVYHSVAAHAAKIVSIHLSKAVSGTYQAAIVGSRPIENTVFEHVNSRNASVGLGLVVRAAAEAAAAGKPFDEVVRIARDATDRVSVYIAVPTLEHLVRGGRVPRGKGILAKILGLLPVLTLTKKGTAEPAGKARGFDAALKKMMALLFQAAEAGKGGAGTRFGVAHCDAPELAERLARQIRDRSPESDVMIVECGPALGAHGGPGAVAVAVLP